MKLKLTTALLPIVLITHNTPTIAAETITEAIEQGKTSLSFRLRHEDVDQDGLEETNALTLKTRINYKTADYKGLTAFLEIDDVTELDTLSYRTAGNDPNYVGVRPVIADPEGTEVNQAWLSYQGIEDTTIKWGRQRITLDNHRFVGHVAWRQNEQTYDSATLTNTSLTDTTLFISQISNVRRVFGEDNVIGEHNTDHILFNAKYTGLPFGSITAYHYDFDYEDIALADRSSTTTGLRFSGKSTPSEKLDVSYVAEYATQSDAHDNPASYDASYQHLEAGITTSGVTLKLGSEVLGSDSTNGVFQTNLATLHKFQGWTDKFLNGGRGNMLGGIQDNYVSIGGSLHGIKLMAVYHDFSADDSSAAGMDDYGSEFGFVATKKLGKNYGLQLKYADYSADDFATDTKKVWLTANAKY